MNFSHENDGDKSAKFLEKRGQYLHTELNRFRQCVSHVETGLSMVRRCLFLFVTSPNIKLLVFVYVFVCNIDIAE